MDTRFEGKVCLAAASGSGIGEATAKRFAAEGGSVVVVDFNSDAAERVVNEIRAAGGEASAYVADVADTAQSEAMVEFAVEKYGGLDIIHNNAVAMESGKIEYLTPEGWDKTLRVTLTSAFLGTKFAIPRMRERGGGAIVNTASVSGLFGDPGMGAYNAAKHGVVGLTKATALEYAREGIRANCVCPGTTATPMILSYFGECDPTATELWSAPGQELKELDERGRKEVKERMASAHPIGRFGKPGEIAAVIAFLASVDAANVTGAVYVADGGLTAFSGTPAFYV